MGEGRSEIYKLREEKFSEMLAVSNKKIRRTGWLRVLIFVLMIIFIIISVKFNFPYTLIFIPFCLAGFIYLIKVSNGLKRKRDIEENHIQINKNEQQVLLGNYAMFDNGNEFSDPSHSYGYDLDMFGQGSLFQYLNRCCTIPGKNELADWLINPVLDKDTILIRQKSVIELAPRLDWRQGFQANGMLFDESEKDKQSVLDWVNERPVFKNRRFMKAILIAIPAATILILGLCFAKLIPWTFFLVMFLVQLSIVGSNTKRISRIIEKVSRRYKLLIKYGELINKIEKEDFESPMLIELKQLLKTNEVSAGKNLNQLSGIIQGLHYRNDMVMGVLLNATLLWDLQYVVRLENWQEKFKTELPKWFNTISKVEALACLSNLHYNNPAYVFPEPSGNILMEAKELGHPLLDSRQRVNNDFSLKNYGHFRIITGANMAGKSTFLRTIGVNLILAMAGGPVCATGFSFRPTKIYTSMRTSDSLQKNESYFYAELLRLKNLILRLREGERIFIILDEILKGTNSTDKQLGSKAVLEQLVSLEGAGVIATHDLALGELEKESPENITNQCFEIEIDGENIRFDYKLKSGITQKMNALILMKQMGIRLEN